MKIDKSNVLFRLGVGFVLGVAVMSACLTAIELLNLHRRENGLLEYATAFTLAEAASIVPLFWRRQFSLATWFIMVPWVIGFGYFLFFYVLMFVCAVFGDCL